MIQINDYDSPITAAQKIIHGIKTETRTASKRRGLIFTNGEAPIECDCYEVLFSPDDIREIAEYLQTYCKYNVEDD